MECLRWANLEIWLKETLLPCVSNKIFNHLHNPEDMNLFKKMKPHQFHSAREKKSLQHMAETKIQKLFFEIIFF